MTVVCRGCLEDNNSEVRKLARDLKFTSNKYTLLSGSYPCGCAKQRGKTLLQHFGVDDFIGNTKNYPNNTLTVSECLGGKGNKRKYVLLCNRCSEDSKLWPYGSIVSTKSNFQTRGTPPCGCNPNKTHLQEWQHKIRIERICNSKGLTFKGWVGEFAGTNKTRVKMHCPYHGLSSNTKVDKLYIDEGGCRDCAQELGKFGYYPSMSDEADTLYLFEEQTEGFLKVGRSFDLCRRKYQHENLSGYKFTILGTYEDCHEKIFKLEQKILHETRELKYQPSKVWSGGKRECRTYEILNHPEVISIFNLKENHNVQ